MLERVLHCNFDTGYDHPMDNIHALQPQTTITDHNPKSQDFHKINCHE